MRDRHGEVARDSLDFVDALRAKDQNKCDDAVLRQMTTDQRKLEELAEDYATDMITRRAWMRAREVLEVRLRPRESV